MKKILLAISIFVLLCSCSEADEPSAIDSTPYIEAIQTVADISEEQAQRAYSVLNQCEVYGFKKIYMEGQDEYGKIIWADDVNGQEGLDISFNVNNGGLIDFVCIRKGRVLYQDYKLVMKITEA